MFKATEESPRMFESDFFDFFSRTHPAVVPALFVPATAWLLFVSHGLVGAAVTAALFVGGFFVWTLTEYWLHRTFFHWQPPGKWGERMHFLVHGVHHTWPKDKYRLVMPPVVSISVFFLFLGIFSGIGALTGLASYAWAFHGGFVIGYVAYDLTHYWIHHFTPKSAYGRKLKKHHMLHHFKSPDARFGVSWMFWDHVFGTVGDRKI